MKTMITYRLLGLLCLGTAVLPTISCTVEDMSACPGTGHAVSVVFTDPYGNDDMQTGLNADEFSHVTFFIYDHSGQLVTSVELSDFRLDREYPLNINLPSGSYEMVAWVSTKTSFYGFDNTGVSHQASLGLLIPQTRSTVYRIDHLYYGQSAFKADGSVVKVPLLQFSNDINCTVKGLDRDGSYTVKIEDNNGKYGFDGAFLATEHFTYASDVTITGEHHFSAVTILRLGVDRTPMLSLNDDSSGEVLYPSYDGQEANLVALIKKAYQNDSFDFDSRHVFNLTIEFDGEMRATVFINDWEVKDNEYEI